MTKSWQLPSLVLPVITTDPGPHICGQEAWDTTDIQMLVSTRIWEPEWKFFCLFLIWNKFTFISCKIWGGYLLHCWYAVQQYFLHIHIQAQLGMCLKYDFKCEESILDWNDLIKNTSLGPFIQDFPLGSFLAVYQILYKSYVVQAHTAVCAPIHLSKCLYSFNSCQLLPY